jgi:zinc transport system substrate-binding protein
MPRSPILPSVLLVAILVASGCASDEGGGSGADRLTVVASSYPLAEATRRIGGDAVDVINLTPPGVEPHDLELSPEQVEQIATADLVVFVGGGFQPAVEEAVETIAEGTSVDVLDGLSLIEGFVGEHAGEDEEHVEEAASASDVDPHVWMDPALMADVVSTIEGSLAALDPERASVFIEGAERFDAELSALDEGFRRGLQDCERRLLVTSHAAFGYLARAYGLEQEAIVGLSPEAEPSAQELAAIAEEIRADGVTTVFTETLVSPKLAETLASEAGATTAVLNPLEGLSQEQIEAGEDYGSVMRDNLAALQAGLGCA